MEHEEDKNSIKGCMARLEELLSDIRHHRDSWPFLSPVTKEEVPDYYDIISNPMDFGTIKSKLGDDKYERLDEFFSDCQLIFENCRLYNKENSSVYRYVLTSSLSISHKFGCQRSYLLYLIYVINVYFNWV